MRPSSLFLLRRAPLLAAIAVTLTNVGCGGPGRTPPPSNAGGGGDASIDEAGVVGDPIEAGAVGPMVTVTINPAIHHQTLVGFGAGAVYYTSYLSDRRIGGDDIYNVLFTDLGLDMLRIANWYQTQSVSGTTPATPFTDTAMVNVVTKATAAMGHPPLLLMSSWSPPAYLKNTGVTKPSMPCDAGTCQGTLVRDASGAYAYGDFANWWVESLAAYAQHGVVPDYMSIQNEPDFFTNSWETCRFDAAEGTNAGYGQALDAVYGAVTASTLASKPLFIGPEASGIRGNRVPGYVASATTPTQLSAVAHHLYNGGGTGVNPAPDSFNAAMTAIATSAGGAGKPIFMTEYSPPSPAMFETAWLIHNALTVEGVSAYLYWELFWAAPTSGVSASLVVLDNPSSLTTPKGYTINDTYYALKHFAKWTDPGHVRIDASSPDAALKVSAFLAPDESSVTLIVLNTDAAASRQLALDASAYAFSSEAVYRTSGASERAASITLAGDGTVDMPPRSIVTITLTR
jgi:glucuronoarabinoxylan endo-1,4-beta-xylanase